MCQHHRQQVLWLLRLSQCHLTWFIYDLAIQPRVMLVLNIVLHKFWLVFIATEIFTETAHLEKKDVIMKLQYEIRTNNYFIWSDIFFIVHWMFRHNTGTCVEDWCAPCLFHESACLVWSWMIFDILGGTSISVKK